MIGTRHDVYKNSERLVPFLVYKDLVRTGRNFSKERNWHEDIELQLCTKGSGTVILNGEKHPFSEGDMIAVNSNIIHYTGTERELTYSCIIISSQFCRSVGFDYGSMFIQPLIKDEVLKDMFCDICEMYYKPDLKYRELKLNEKILSVLSRIAEKHLCIKKADITDEKSFDTVRKTVEYLRENYERKLTLEEIAKAVLTDKYSLCRTFKRLTGQTVIENLNEYRCIRAKELLSDGMGVSESARACGFENISFFTKTFKKYTGFLPSQCKNR